MKYEIKTVNSIEEVTLGNIAEIDQYNWGGEYRPKSQAQLVYVKNQGFAVRLTSYETNPRAVFTEQNQGVCRDSCLEFFANFCPELENSGYVNFECNVKGSLLCCYGNNVEKRKTLVELGLPHPSAVPFQDEEKWGYVGFMPLSTLKEIYGKDDFKTGDLIRGNFFKCGDDTEIPHFGSYTVIDNKVILNPSFHRPNYFAYMTIV